MITESKGVPSVSVITSAFTRAARMRATTLGMPRTRMVILPSPLATRSVLVGHLAHQYATEIVGLLADPHPAS